MTQDPNELQEDQVDISSTADEQTIGNEDIEQDSGASNTDTKALQLQIEQLNEELSQAKERALRAHAESQNAQRRAQQDVEKAHKFGLEKLVNDILPVADNLERALATVAEHAGDNSAITEGIELTLKSFIDALSRHKVEQINPENEPFDPQFHQAMTALEQPDMEPNTVINVFQKGYTLHGRLVRPAMVVVSKAAG